MGHKGRVEVGWLVGVQRPIQHIISHFWDDFYMPDDQTNSVKALKKTSWSSRSCLNPTRTTPPCYNNKTLRNCLYARYKAPNVINPICWTCKNCSHKSAADSEHASHKPARSSSDNIPYTELRQGNKTHQKYSAERKRTDWPK